MLKGMTSGFRLASKIIPNKQAKTMLNLLAMGTGASSNLKDPKALVESLGGPLEDISKGVTEEQEKEDKRLSDLTPSTQLEPVPDAPPRASGGPATSQLPATRLSPDSGTLLTPQDRLRSVRGF